MTNNLFGTDGIRNTIGQLPFSAEYLPKLGKAIAQWAISKYGATPTMLIGHDTRVSSSFVKSSLQSGLLLYPVTLYDAHVSPTPMLCQLTQHSTIFNCAIVISASHNPYQDNGIKIIDHAHGKISLHDEHMISSLFYAQPTANTYETLGSVTAWTQGEQRYSAYISSFFKNNFLYGKKIVLDCANGATSTIAPSLFQHFGATVITIHNQPNGININHQCGALYVNSIQQAVIEHNADMGFAFDGDGDRVIAINKEGHIKNGDDILALLLDHPLYKKSSCVVGTVMTNQGFAAFLTSRNISLIRARVGDKYVSENLIKENLLVGGEQSGHIIMRDYLDTGDGIFTALRIAETIVHTQNWSMHTFSKYPQILINIPVSIKKDLESPELASIIAQGTAQLTSGRLVIRYSGTENLLRIMIEDNELKQAQRIGNFLSQALQKELSGG